ncbi:MAG: hypothetical protein ACRDPM_18525, partial [Solirubrobacteraceae bacterium]
LVVDVVVVDVVVVVVVVVVLVGDGTVGVPGVVGVPEDGGLGFVVVPVGGEVGDDGFGLCVLTQRWTLMYTIRPCRCTIRP